jgi:hypothetical protein
LVRAKKILAKRAEQTGLKRVPDVAHQVKVEAQIMHAHQNQCEYFTRFE